MTKNKKSKYLGLFSILTLSILGLIISCSTADNTGLDKILEDEIGIIEGEILEQFKQNYAGSYTPDSTAVIQMDGYDMPFTGLDIRITALTNNNKLYFTTYVNGPQGSATLFSVTFNEGDETYPSKKQVVVPQTATNVFLKNVYGVATGGTTLEGDNVIELIINPDNGDLIYDSVKIGTKN